MFVIVLYIAASIALLALAWLFISLVSTVNSLKGLVDNANKTVQDLVGEVKGIRGSLQGTIQNVELITSRVPATIDNVNQSIERVNGQLDQVEGIMGSVQKLTGDVLNDVSRITGDATDLIHRGMQVAESLIDLEQNLQLKVQAPVVELMSIFSALGKGLHVFRHKLSGTPAANGYMKPHAMVNGGSGQ